MNLEETRWALCEVLLSYWRLKSQARQVLQKAYLGVLLREISGWNVFRVSLATTIEVIEDFILVYNLGLEIVPI